ncbi:MAG: flagellar hook-associated protein FlgK [Chthonomonadales bacterium]|nr:flagellar hook-associated protein FlgK [Chthonomonadales bacterium]
MASTFGTFEIARGAMRTSQTAMTVIGHNIANINTPGYSRQTVEIVATEPYTVPGLDHGRPGQVGTGVDVASIRRVRDVFVDQRLQAAGAERAEVSQLAELLDRVQSLYMEPGAGGIGIRTTAFFSAFHDLAGNPERAELRAAARQSGVSLASQIRAVHGALEGVEGDIADQVRANILDANSLAGQVAELNTQIANSLAVGDHPNDLQDRRDEIIRRLGALAGVDSTVELDAGGKPTGHVSVFVAGFALVQGGHAAELPERFQFSGGTPYLVDGDERIELRGGSLAGMARASEHIAAYKSDLDALASTLIGSVNALHSTGYGQDGQTGIAFFTGAGAADIAVSPEVQTDAGAIAAGAALPGGGAPPPGNGEAARAIADLADARLIGQQTLGESYATSVALVGADARTYAERTDSLDLLVEQLQSLRSSVSGVSLNEELTMMLQHQRSYQAAARLLNTFDDALKTLIDTLGR